MDRSTWVVVGVVVALAAAAIFLPLLGLGLVFRREIAEALLGPSEPTSGTRLVYEVPNRANGSPADIVLACRILARRLDLPGARGCVVRPGGEDRIEVLVPDGPRHEDEVDRARRLAAAEGALEFRFVVDEVRDRDKADLERIVRIKQAGQPPDDAAYKWCRVKRGWEWHTNPADKGGNLLERWNWVYVADDQARTVEALVDVDDGEDVTGEDLEDVAPMMQDGEPMVAFRLRADAGPRFARLTRPEMHGRQMAIILDGVIQSAPVLRATLSTGGIIEGYRDNSRERDEIVSILNSGRLGVHLGEPVAVIRFGTAAGH